MPKTLPHTRAFFYYLLLTAVLCGGLIMVIEVLGSRVIGPFFGVSLFVWTSLIAVTLITLAIGYGVGGMMADRHPSPSVMYGTILLAALFVLIIPWLKQPILEFSFPLGLRMGTFVSAALLLGPSLLLLGCVSPYLVKIVSREVTHLGKTVGGFYALSTLGSVIGTVLTGFVLIAYFHTNQIYQIVGTLLLLLAVGYFVFFRQLVRVVPVLILPFLFTYPESGMTTMQMSNGTEVTLIAEKESHYGSLKVLDYKGGGKHTREMVIDGLIQGGIDMTDKRSIYGYSYFLQYLPRELHPDGKKGLMIGLGAGIVPGWYQQHGVELETIEINPDVIEIARQYFGFQGKVHIADARYFLNSHRTVYDYLLLDVFSGDTTPGYLLSREAVELFSRHLTDEGVLAINMIGSLKENTLMTASVIKTLEQSFDQVEIFPTFNPRNSNGIGNLAVMAYQGGPRKLNLVRIKSYPVNSLARLQVIPTIGHQFRFPDNTDSIILEDDYNPIDFYDAALRESVREQILTTTAWEMLL